MYNYEPLRGHIASNGLTVKALMREVGFSTNVAVALNNDKPVTIEVLADICRHLRIPIEEVVRIELD